MILPTESHSNLEWFPLLNYYLNNLRQFGEISETMA